jgi:hypothetical protein
MPSLSTKKIEFDFEEMKWKGLTVAQIQFWEKCYPDVDVLNHLTKKMPGWLDAERNGKGRKKNWKSFINGWLSREQEKYELFKKA